MSKTLNDVAACVRVAALTILVLLNVACAGSGIVAAPSALSNDVYKVDSGDTLNVTIFGQNDLGGKFLVGADGAMTIPLAGAVPVRGKTLVEVEEAVEAALSPRFVTDAKASVEVSEYRPYFVFGEVSRAGKFPFTPGLTVQQAIATAGGLNYRAAKNDAIITRAQQRLRGDYQTPLLPGDTVEIPPRYF